MKKRIRRTLLLLLPLLIVLVALSPIFARTAGEAQAASTPVAASCSVTTPSSTSTAATQPDDGSPLLVAAVQGQQVGPSDGASGQSLRVAAKCYLVGWKIFYGGCGSKNLYVLKYLCYSSSRGWYYVSYSYCG